MKTGVEQVYNWQCGKIAFIGAFFMLRPAACLLVVLALGAVTARPAAAAVTTLITESPPALDSEISDSYAGSFVPLSLASLRDLSHHVIGWPVDLEGYAPVAEEDWASEEEALSCLRDVQVPVIFVKLDEFWEGRGDRVASLLLDGLDGKRFVLLSGASDGPLHVTDPGVRMLLDSPNLVHWFLQNCEVDHPKASYLPLGIDWADAARIPLATAMDAEMPRARGKAPLEKPRLLLVENSTRPYPGRPENTAMRRQAFDYFSTSAVWAANTTALAGRLSNRECAAARPPWHAISRHLSKHRCRARPARERHVTLSCPLLASLRAPSCRILSAPAQLWRLSSHSALDTRPAPHARAATTAPSRGTNSSSHRRAAGGTATARGSRSRSAPCRSSLTAASAPCVVSQSYSYPSPSCPRTFRAPTAAAAARMADAARMAVVARMAAVARMAQRRRRRRWPPPCSLRPPHSTERGGTTLRPSSRPVPSLPAQSR